MFFTPLKYLVPIFSHLIFSEILYNCLDIFPSGSYRLNVFILENLCLKDFESAIGEFGVVTKLPAGETYGKIRFSTPILDKDEWDFKCNEVIKLGDRLQIQEINKSYLLVSK